LIGLGRLGRALVQALERDLIAAGVSLLQVKTLGPSHPDPSYARTRLFYEAMGFSPLEETQARWHDGIVYSVLRSEVEF
jgi:hypothetical protein